jgi:hypothetical protein
MLEVEKTDADACCREEQPIPREIPVRANRSASQKTKNNKTNPIPFSERRAA